MGHRLLARSLWPLGLALQTSVVVVAGWSDPDSVRRAMGLTTVGFLLVLLALEQILPYRQEWSIRGDREIWRDIGHSVLYTSLGGNLAQILFLYGFASALSRLGLAGGLGIWPVNSPLVAQYLRHTGIPSHSSLDRCDPGELQLFDGVPNLGHDLRHAHRSNVGRGARDRN